jgi:RNA polymerase sigma-70 factor (ECF subfamily)
MKRWSASSSGHSTELILYDIAMSDPRWDEARLAGGYAITGEAFTAFVAARPDASVEHAADLALACACLAQDPAALAEFERRFLTRVDVYVGSLAKAVELDEIRQQLAIKLLVNGRLTSYSGHGPLEGWVRVAASRVAIEQSRKKRESALDDREELMNSLGKELDGELAELRDRYRTEFAAALHESLAALDDAHRAILRLHYLEGTTTEALAVLYRTSRRTIVRRIGEARGALFEKTIELATTRLGLPRDRYLTLLDLVRSQLDVSIRRLLDSQQD